MANHYSMQPTYPRGATSNLLKVYVPWSPVERDGTAIEFDESYIGKHRPDHGPNWTLSGEGSVYNRRKYGWNATINGNLTDKLSRK